MRTTHSNQSHPIDGTASDFDALFARYAAPIYRFSLRLCRNAADAEDLAQEVFVAAFQGRSRFEGRSSLSTYLYRITVFRWRVMREKAGTAPATTIADERADRSSPDIADATVERASLDAALAKLDDRHREAFLLVKVEGMTYREASRVLNIPEGTVKYHVYCAIRQMQKAFADEESAEARSGADMTSKSATTAPIDTYAHGGLP